MEENNTKKTVEKNKIHFKLVLFIAGIFVLGAVFGIVVLKYSHVLISPFKKDLEPIKTEVKKPNESEVKKEALAKFYNEIIVTQDKQDWAKLYTFLQPSIKKAITEEQFADYENAQNKKDESVSQETIVNTIEVNGNKGTVDRTVVKCLTKECTGKNRTEENAKKEYEYVNGKWQLPDPEPSERSLKAANYAYGFFVGSGKKDMENTFAFGTQNSELVVRQWAIYMDKNLDELIRIETWNEKNKAELSRPVYNYQPPAIVQQPDIIVQPPAEQTYPKNCTSNTIGSYTYTNCY